MTYTEARISETIAYLEADKCEMFAMIAANILRDHRGETPAYGEEAFMQVAERMRGHGLAIRQLADSGGLL